MLTTLLMLLEAPEDKEEFEKLYEETYEKLIYKARQILKNTSDAEERVHDCYVVIARDYHTKYRGRSIEQLTGLLFIMVRNSCINLIHERARHKETLIEVDENLLIGGNDPLEDILAGETQEILERVMRKLPDEDRDLFTLKYYYDLSYKEIARLLKVKAKTVDMRLYRAKKKLRALLEDGQF